MAGFERHYSYSTKPKDGIEDKRHREMKIPEPLASQDSFLRIGDCWLTEISNALLLPARPAYKWQNLADLLGYAYEETIERLEQEERTIGINPVYELLRMWGKREGSTFRVMHEKLKALGRFDVSRLLNEAMKGISYNV